MAHVGGYTTGKQSEEEEEEAVEVETQKRQTKTTKEAGSATFPMTYVCLVPRTNAAKMTTMPCATLRGMMRSGPSLRRAMYPPPHRTTVATMATMATVWKRVATNL
jgi:hypothetical protein